MPDPPDPGSASPPPPLPWYGPAIAGFLLSLGGPMTGIALRLVLERVVDISRSTNLIMMMPWAIGVVLCFVSLSYTDNPEAPMRGGKLATIGIWIDILWLLILAAVVLL